MGFIDNITMLTSFLQGFRKEDGSEYTEQEIKEISADEKSMSELFDKIAKDPRYKHYRDIQDAAKALKEGADVYNLFRNISESKDQIRRSEEALRGLQEPAIPTAVPKNVELSEALETARREKSSIREIDPLLQRNMDLLTTGLRRAETASAGQAGLYGSLAQNAVNQTRRANIDAIPAIEQVRRGKFNDYIKLIGMQQREDRDRFYENLNVFDRADKRYVGEAQAAGGLGAAGRSNLATSRQGLGQVLSSLTGTYGPLITGAFGKNRGGVDVSKYDPPYGLNIEGTAKPQNPFSLINDLDVNMGMYGERVNSSLFDRFQYFPRTY